MQVQGLHIAGRRPAVQLRASHGWRCWRHARLGWGGWTAVSRVPRLKKPASVPDRLAQQGVALSRAPFAPTPHAAMPQAPPHTLDSRSRFPVVKPCCCLNFSRRASIMSPKSFRTRPGSRYWVEKRSALPGGPVAPGGSAPEAGRMLAHHRTIGHDHAGTCSKSWR